MTAAPAKLAPTLAVPWWDRSSRWIAFGMFVAVLLAYAPIFSAGYIWDDAGHVTRPELRTLGGLFRIWFEPGATQQYYPLLHSAFWLEAHVWGDAPLGYHLLNLLLHATSACLFAAVLRRLAVPGAWLAAILFALHPVAVESVAWVSEQKNTLSTALYLFAALAYFRFDEGRAPKAYAWASFLFFLALATKTVAATLPAALLVIFWWRRGTLNLRRDVVPLLPWFGLSLAGALTTSWVEHTLIGAAGADFNLDPVQRVLLAGRAFWFYASKVIWPIDLMFVYPRWTIDASVWWQLLFPLTAIGLVVALWFRHWRGTLAAVLLFGGTLFPALGFINVYPFIYSFVADHFQYLADLALFALIGAGASRFLPRVGVGVGATFITLVALTLGVLTFRQTTMYRSEVTLYETTLARNPAAWMAHINLGISLVNAGRAADAIPHYEAALKLRPDYAEGENNLGYALNAEHRPADAIPHFERALQLHPTYAEAHNNLGISLSQLGNAAEARRHFETAVQLNPHYPEAHLNLGLTLAESGQTNAAITQFAEAARLRPGYGEAELNWAIGLTLTDRFVEAVPHFRRALDLSPDSWTTHLMYGRALARANQLDEAVAQLSIALELNPNSAEAHGLLGQVFRQLGRPADASRELQEAARLGRR